MTILANATDLSNVVQEITRQFQVEQARSLAEVQSSLARAASMEVRALAAEKDLRLARLQLTRQSAVLALLRREHTVDADDPARSCPASGKNPLPDVAPDCTCGADETNQILDLVIAYGGGEL